MLIGVPKEIKDNEYRVGMTPGGVRDAVTHGHRVLVQSGAGTVIGFTDDAYRGAGATLAPDAATVFAQAEMIVKVKEPQHSEYALLRDDQVLFTYLHLAPDREQTNALVQSGCVAIAYETVTDAAGRLPLLAPMSEVAGRLAPQMGAWALMRSQGGIGVLLGGVPGVLPAKVAVLGGGVVGENAARIALGMGADVTVLDNYKPRLQELDRAFGPGMKTVFASTAAIELMVVNADLVVGAVLVPGAAAPKLVSRELVRRMLPGSAIVDVSIDQGGCFETSRPTSHSDPLYIDEGVVHYCVTNMPGGVARTSTLALTSATLPYVLKLADLGWQQALAADPTFLVGLNVIDGKVTNAQVAKAHGILFVDPRAALRG